MCVVWLVETVRGVARESMTGQAAEWGSARLARDRLQGGVALFSVLAAAVASCWAGVERTLLTTITLNTQSTGTQYAFHQIPCIHCTYGANPTVPMTRICPFPLSVRNHDI